MKKLGLLGLASVVALAACSDRTSPVAPPPAMTPPVASVGGVPGAPIANRYIVVFRQGTDVDRESARIASFLGGKTPPPRRSRSSRAWRASSRTR